MAENVYTTPDANLVGESLTGDYGNMRRLPYFLYTLVIQAVYLVGIVAFGMMESAAVLGVCMVVMVLASVYIVVKRFQNQGASGWWAAGMLVPLLNFYVGLRALAFPEGYNDHKTLDTAAKVIIGLFVGSIVLGIGAAIALPAMMGV